MKTRQAEQQATDSFRHWTPEGLRALELLAKRTVELAIQQIREEQERNRGSDD